MACRGSGVRVPSAPLSVSPPSGSFAHLERFVRSPRAVRSLTSSGSFAHLERFVRSPRAVRSLTTSGSFAHLERFVRSPRAVRSLTSSGSFAHLERFVRSFIRNFLLSPCAFESAGGKGRETDMNACFSALERSVDVLRNLEGRIYFLDSRSATAFGLKPLNTSQRPRENSNTATPIADSPAMGACCSITPNITEK
jgi:hypothetical protein